MSGEELVRRWKDPDSRPWPDDDHPAGQMYLQLSGLVGGNDQVMLSTIAPPPPPETLEIGCSISVSVI